MSDVYESLNAESMMAARRPASSGAFRPPLLCMDGVLKKFGGVTAVDRLSLDIQAGEFFALLGPSGCGKSTLLRMLAGFETPDDGQILLDGVDIAMVPPHQRNVNMMFQNYALFPHLDVQNNIAFGLKRAGLPRAEIDLRVREMLALVKLEGMERRRPDQLSGGQKQRVALARALARRPQVLLLDEPLAALDKKLRESTQRELMDLQRRLGTTFVVVTHDQDEAMSMADRIGVMNAGRLDQVATPRQLYEAPCSRWIAEFVGDINILEGEIIARGDHSVVVRTNLAGELTAAAPALSLPSDAACIAIRPEKLRLTRSAPAQNIGAGAVDTLACVVTDVSFLGGITIYQLRLESGGMLRAALANTARRDGDAFALGEGVTVSFAPADCVVVAL